MSGIVGYTGGQSAYPVLLSGLKKLEYRGYDSAGMALLCPKELKIAKTMGKISILEKMIGGDGYLQGLAGIGHIRWATHGAPSDINAHPHLDCSQKFAIVHNGIIENYLNLRRWLEERGHRFISETDSEVLAHLIEHFFDGDLFRAVANTVEKVEGSFAMAAIYDGEKEKLVCARRDCPLIIGLGEGENFVASDVPAFLDHTRRAYILENGEIAVVTADAVEIYTSRGEIRTKKVDEITWNAAEAEKEGYPHFMIKEIMEQPQALRRTMQGRLGGPGGGFALPELNLTPEEIGAIEQIYIIACGTSYHAGLVAKYTMERILKIPVEVDLASEFCYREPLLDKNMLFIVISQSGETADTLAALRLARKKGKRVLAITNIVGSSVAREADNVFFTWAGPEIAVASTKAYLTQLSSLYLITYYLAQEKGSLSGAELGEAGNAMLNLPDLVETILARTDEIQKMAAYLAPWESCFYIGRNIDYAVALEGALKLKEISYVHAEAYASGELKHGTLALVTEGIPVVALVTQRAIIEKSLSNIKEIKARGGHVFCFAQEGEATDEFQREVDGLFRIPATLDILMPILSVIPLQLLAYHTAIARGCPVDNPRNLTKSVTVE